MLVIFQELRAHRIKAARRQDLKKKIISAWRGKLWVRGALMTWKVMLRPLHQFGIRTPVYPTLGHPLERPTWLPAQRGAH